METERERNRRLYPEMAHVIDSCAGSVTGAAILEDGEVTSGRMPADDYKVAWVSADGWSQARTVLKEQTRQAALKTPKSWVKRFK